MQKTTRRFYRSTWRQLGQAVLMFFALNSTAFARKEITPIIDQSRAADPTVNYAALMEIGPWDDRNYALTARDIALLSPKEHESNDAIPAFFRVEMRRANPKLPRAGEAQYPLSAMNAYQLNYDGYLVNGTLYKGIERIRGNNYVYFDLADEDAQSLPSDSRRLTGEARVSSPIGASESAISINPVNPNLVIAGSNGPGGGQKMWRSSDAGATWLAAQPLTGGGTCCDPTVSWSTDGTKAYTSALVDCGSSCGIRFYRSDDNGNLWGDNDNATSVPPPVTLVASGADKQFIHVDTVSTRFKDRIYMCWHEGNVQKLSYSTDFGVTFVPTRTLDTTARSVGCDITTDPDGNLYYFMPALDSGAVDTRKQIRMIKSTDGGDTFLPTVTVAATNDGFNYALPSMETRKVAKIVQADTDLSNGPFRGSVYVAWPDITALESTTAANNHSQIKVAYSRDGGATWQTSIPHETDDVLTVDRFQSSIKVDDQGRVHVIYNDTRRSPNRTAIDVYYAMSIDGGVSWTPPAQITAAISPNINDSNEYGDYSHMDGVMQNVMAIYTDNRDEAGGTTQSKDIYAAGDFILPATPTFVQSPVGGGSRNVCAGSTFSLPIAVRGFLGFVDPVTYSAINPPAGITDVSFTPNPLVPSAQGSNVTIAGTIAAAATGSLALTVRGTSASGTPIVRDSLLNFTVSQALAAAPALLTPADASQNLPSTTTFTWQAVAGASSYTVDVSRNADFGGVVTSSTVTTTSANITLNPNRTYYWRVRASNACGDSSASPVRQYTTRNEICFTPNVAIPDNSALGGIATLPVSNLFLGDVLSMKVDLRLSHTYIGDLSEISIKRTGGSTVRLLPVFSSCSGDNVDASFDDSSTLASTCSNTATPAVGPGAFKPLDALSALTGPLAGSYEVKVVDNAVQDVGVIERVCLVPTVANSDRLFTDGLEE